jgi:hypothetical protein
MLLVQEEEGVLVQEEEAGVVLVQAGCEVRYARSGLHTENGLDGPTPPRSLPRRHRSPPQVRPRPLAGNSAGLHTGLYGR